MTKIIEISVHLFEFVLVRRSHLDVVLFDYLYQSFGEGGVVGKGFTMRAWPVARSIFDAPYVREANERTASWIRKGYGETVVRRMSD